MDYLLIFGLGIAAPNVLVTMGTDIADFVIETIRDLIV